MTRTTNINGISFFRKITKHQPYIAVGPEWLIFAKSEAAQSVLNALDSHDCGQLFHARSLTEERISEIATLACTDASTVQRVITAYRSFIDSIERLASDEFLAEASRTPMPLLSRPPAVNE